MPGRYIGIDPIITKSGKVIKTNDIIQEMPDEEAKQRIGFELVTSSKKEFKKKQTGDNDE